MLYTLDGTIRRRCSIGQTQSEEELGFMRGGEEERRLQ